VQTNSLWLDWITGIASSKKRENMGITFGRKLTGAEKAQQHQEILRSREIDEMNEAAHRKEMLVAKMLLLGAGESGKSTLFKQIIGLYGKGWSVNDRKKYKEAVYTNISKFSRCV
jgi:hypothetical protein